MTQVDFYILNDDARGPDEFACRLTEKAYQLGHSVYIHTADRAHAAAIDDLLWTFKAGSFVPHDIQDKDVAEGTQIVIGYDQEPARDRDVLINLTDDVPLFFSRFQRLAEIVANEQPRKVKARERFRFYRERGYPLESHNIG